MRLAGSPARWNTPATCLMRSSVASAGGAAGSSAGGGGCGAGCARSAALEMLAAAERARAARGLERDGACGAGGDAAGAVCGAGGARRRMRSRWCLRSVTLSYAALDAHANRLAHQLRGARGGARDAWWGCCVERSLEMVIGLLGILKAGGAYLPLDPAYPAERLAFMLEDAGCGVLVTPAGVLDGCGSARRRCATAAAAAAVVWCGSTPTGARSRCSRRSRRRSPRARQPRLRDLHLRLNRNAQRASWSSMAVFPISQRPQIERFAITSQRRVSCSSRR